MMKRRRKKGKETDYRGLEMIRSTAGEKVIGGSMRDVWASFVFYAFGHIDEGAVNEELVQYPSRFMKGDF